MSTVPDGICSAPVPPTPSAPTEPLPVPITGKLEKISSSASRPAIADLIRFIHVPPLINMDFLFILVWERLQNDVRFYPEKGVFVRISNPYNLHDD
ncbi:hypothetical protein D3C76_1293960 [compost metagenome]